MWSSSGLPYFIATDLNDCFFISLTKFLKTLFPHFSIHSPSMIVLFLSLFHQHINFWIKSKQKCKQEHISNSYQSYEEDKVDWDLVRKGLSEELIVEPGSKWWERSCEKIWGKNSSVEGRASAEVLRHGWFCHTQSTEGQSVSWNNVVTSSYLKDILNSFFPLEIV